MPRVASFTLTAVTIANAGRGAWRAGLCPAPGRLLTLSATAAHDFQLCGLLAAADSSREVMGQSFVGAGRHARLQFFPFGRAAVDPLCAQAVGSLARRIAVRSSASNADEQLPVLAFAVRRGGSRSLEEAAPAAAP